jgi:hypothetical protein
MDSGEQRQAPDAEAAVELVKATLW